jgi:histidine ammonia-lyase
MGSVAALHARDVLGTVEQILAIELLCAAQALDLRLASLGGMRPGAGVAQALALVRSRVAHLDADREPGPDLAAARALVREGVLAQLAEPA